MAFAQRKLPIYSTTKTKNQPYGSVGPNHRYYDFLWDKPSHFPFINYTESGWDHYVPYQIRFDDCEDEQTTSRLIFAPRDSDTCIRATIPTESESLEDLMTEFQLTYFLNKAND